MRRPNGLCADRTKCVNKDMDKTGESDMGKNRFHTLFALSLVSVCTLPALLTGCASCATTSDRQNPVGQVTVSRQSPAELHEDPPSAPNGLEGIQWRLVEVGGAPVSTPANEKQPYIMFDPATKKVTGYAGCNNFFAGYERDGTKLKFGLIGSTRRACPDPETAVEAGYFKALANAREWKIGDDALLLVDGDEILARFTMVMGDDAVVDPGSLTYISPRLPSGRVTLSREANCLRQIPIWLRWHLLVLVASTSHSSG